MAKGSNTFEEYKKLHQELENGEIKPVYLLQGAEFFLLDQMLQKIESSVLGNSDADFNRKVFYGKDAEIKDILAACHKFPLMADRQLVILKEAHDLKNAEEIMNYVNRPLESTVLVWFHPKGKIAGNTKLFKAFQNHRIFTADEVSEFEMPQVVINYLSSKGYEIETNALKLTIDKGGNNFTNTLKELQKVLAVVPKTEKIQIAHIEKFVGVNRKYNIFELQKALAGKHKKAALDIVDFFIKNPKDHPSIMIMATLFSYFRKVAIFQSLKGKSEKEIMSLVGIPFMAIADYRKTAANYSVLQIQKVINILHYADLQSKGIEGSANDSEQILEEAVIKILSL